MRTNVNAETKDGLEMSTKTHVKAGGYRPR